VAGGIQKFGVAGFAGGFGKSKEETPGLKPGRSDFAANALRPSQVGLKRRPPQKAASTKPVLGVETAGPNKNT
jgi:hypothetical protein